MTDKECTQPYGYIHISGNHIDLKCVCAILQIDMVGCYSYKIILDNKKEIRYREQRQVKEYLMKWDTIIDFAGSDTQIRIRKLRFQNEKSMVLVGRQNAINKTTLIQLVNEFARELKCRNYTPIAQSKSESMWFS